MMNILHSKLIKIIINSEANLNFPSAKIATIISNTLNVDAELIDEIKREIKTDDCRLLLYKLIFIFL